MQPGDVLDTADTRYTSNRSKQVVIGPTSRATAATVQLKRQTDNSCNRYIISVKYVTYRRVPWKTRLPTATLPFNHG